MPTMEEIYDKAGRLRQLGTADRDRAVATAAVALAYAERAAERDAPHQRLDDQDRRYAAELQDQLENARKGVANGSILIAQLGEEITELREAGADLADRMNAKEQQLQGLRVEANQMHDELKTKKQQHDREVATLQGQIENARQRERAWAKNCEDAWAKLQQLTDASIDEGLRSSGSENAMQQQIEHLKGVNTQLRLDLRRRSTIINDQKATIANQRKRSKRSNAAAERLQAEVNELAKELRATTEELQLTRDREDALSRALDDEADKRTNAEKQSKYWEDAYDKAYLLLVKERRRIQHLEKRLQGLQGASARLGEKDEKISQLQDQLEQAESLRKAACTEADNLRLAGAEQAAKVDGLRKQLAKTERALLGERLQSACRLEKLKASRRQIEQLAALSPVAVTSPSAASTPRLRPAKPEDLARGKTVYWRDCEWVIWAVSPVNDRVDLVTPEEFKSYEGDGPLGSIHLRRAAWSELQVRMPTDE